MAFLGANINFPRPHWAWVRKYWILFDRYKKVLFLIGITRTGATYASVYLLGSYRIRL